MQPADSAYAKTRTDLKTFEEAMFAALRAYVPNFYRDGKEDTMWGWRLRALAQQLARIEFRTHALIYGTDPALLNPAELVRRFKGPLFLNKNYPGAKQLDADFRTMVLGLLSAYRQGATTQAIRDVLKAYTGEVYEVEELYKQIGTFYDTSDRNSIRIGVKVMGSGDLATVQGITRVKDVVADLYGAIDLAKPAHVGINLTTVMQEDPDPIILQLTDDLQITMLLDEAEPVDPTLHQAPFLNASTPDTGLAPAILNLTYRWFKNGVLVAGQTTDTLVLTNLQLTDDGAEVWAEVTDPILGKVWSKKGVISVHDGAGHGTNTIRPQRPAPFKAEQTLVTTTNPYSTKVLVGAGATFMVAAKNSVVPGALAPHINKAWEIKSDAMFGLDLD